MLFAIKNNSIRLNSLQLPLAAATRSSHVITITHQSWRGHKTTNMATRYSPRRECRKRNFPFERDKKIQEGDQTTKRLRFDKRGWQKGVIEELGQYHFFIKPSNPLPQAYSKRDVYANRALISTYLPEIRNG